MSEQQPKPDLTPQSNPLFTEPATVENCAQDRAAHGIGCEGAARDQFAFTRINASGGNR